MTDAQKAKRRADKAEIQALAADMLEMMLLIENTEEEADCLIWQGATNKGYPNYKPFGGPWTLVRRTMFRLNGGNLVLRQPIDMKCNEKLCINPKHLVASTTSKIAKKAAARGAYSTKNRCIKIALAKRAASKLTIEIAREIRMSEETGPVLAARYGVNRGLVSRIKRGEAWRDYSNMWSGLGGLTA